MNSPFVFTYTWFYSSKFKLKRKKLLKGSCPPTPLHTHPSLVVVAGRPWICTRFICLYTGRYISPLASVLSCYFCSAVAEIVFTAALPVPGIT